MRNSGWPLAKKKGARSTNHSLGLRVRTAKNLNLRSGQFCEKLQSCLLLHSDLDNSARTVSFRGRSCNSKSIFCGFFLWVFAAQDRFKNESVRSQEKGVSRRVFCENVRLSWPVAL